MNSLKQIIVLFFFIVDTGDDPLEDLKTDDSIPDFDDDNNMEYEFKGILHFLKLIMVS